MDKLFYYIRIAAIVAVVLAVATVVFKFAVWLISLVITVAVVLFIVGFFVSKKPK